MKYKFYFIFLLLFGASSDILAQAKTIIYGVVIDEKTKEPIEYASIQFGEGNLGVSTDVYGKFYLEKIGIAKSVKVSFVGYITQIININNGKENEIKVLLRESSAELQELVVRPQKYSKKNNPAIDLIKEVFEHREQNRKESLPFYEFKTHEKLRFDVNGVTERFASRWYFKPFRYAFRFCDTNRVNQKVSLPFYFRERLLTSYFRRDPSAKKEKLWAERQTAFDDEYNIDTDGISTYINTMYSDIDIYEPTVTLLDKQFVGPVSAIATSFYRFYITDTVIVDNQRFATLYFSPTNKNDLAFMGTMLVALDGTYAIHDVDMGISKDININWVKEIKIRQHFDFQGDSTNRRLMLTRDELLYDMKIWKNKEGRSLMASKRNYYQDYTINQPKEDSLYRGKTKMYRDTGNLARTKDYWATKRHDTLTTKEANIERMVDSIKSMKLVKRLTKAGVILGSGFATFGPVQIGTNGNFYRYNDVEGTRLQLHARTNDKRLKYFRIRAYTAYGFRDHRWKYGGSTTIALKGAKPARFPVNQFKFSYDNDLYLPGALSNFGQNLSTSLQSGGTNRMLQNRVIRVDYAKEFANNGFSYTLSGLRRAVNEIIRLDDSTLNRTDIPTITTELSAWIRWAPNEKFYQGNEVRTSIRSKYPVFTLQYRQGIKDLFGGEYAYQRLNLRISKFFYLAPFGKMRIMSEVGQIFGKVSYPLLEIHRSNLSYFHDEEAFNLMNYLEFVSDRYAMLHVNHDFGGLFLNRIPLIKKLRLREGFTFKALYGDLGTRNIPTESNGLLAFPVNAQQQVLTRSLDSKPYLEMSGGIGNLFGFLRIDYVRRLTYLEQPNAQKWGLKFMFTADF